MTKEELIKELAVREGLSQNKVFQVLDSLVEIIRSEVKLTGRFAVANLGVFKLRDRVARFAGPNKIPVPARKAVVFKPAVDWKRYINPK